jgi:copper chaperone CopZ
MQHLTIEKWFVTALAITATFVFAPYSCFADHPSQNKKTETVPGKLFSSNHVSVKPKPKASNDPSGSITAYIRKAEFDIIGAGCVTCIRQIERMLKSAKGVESARVDGFSPPKATIIYDMDKTSIRELIDQVKKAGYGIKNDRDSFYRTAQAPKLNTDSGTSVLLKMPELRSEHLQ